MNRIPWFLSTLLGYLLLHGCVGDPEPPTFRIHLLNPWDDATPSIHGENIGNWSRAAMVQEDACGWFVYTHPGSSLGLFRFLKGESWNINYGSAGHGSTTNFNVDSLLQQTDDVWIDTSSGLPMVEVTRPVIAGCDDESTEPEVPAAGDAAFPFPSQVAYGRGISPQFMSWTHVQSLYELWRREFFVESGDMARVAFDDRNPSTSAEAPQYTVSEGIGYGMLISVILDNAHNRTRRDFDRLWNTYRHFQNENGFMHWKISGFDTVVEPNGASDADLDVALALLMAYLQWRDATHLADARTLMAAIRTHQINARGFLKPGDAWDGAKNPSYFSFAAFRYFAHFDSGHATFWENVVEVQYDLLQRAAHGITGLVPNWCGEDGAPTNPNNGYGVYFGHFGFDAIRVPWRTGWDYLWNGDSRGRDIANRIATWSKTKTGGQATSLRSLYTLSGDAIAAHDYTAQGAFTGAMAVACMMDAAHQDYLDALYAQLRNQAGTVSYYHTTLQVLYAALLTGNMPDFLQM